MLYELGWKLSHGSQCVLEGLVSGKMVNTVYGGSFHMCWTTMVGIYTSSFHYYLS